MKKILFILGMVLFSFTGVWAQDDDAEGNEVIRQKMNEFIQKRLGLTKGESEKFTPVFIRYFIEWRSTLREYRKDPLELKQRVAEVQIRYRNEFRPIIGEKRSNQVFLEQKRFIDVLKDSHERARQRDTRPNKKTGLLLQ